MSERVAYWDNLKFLLITLVVIGHFIDPLTGNYPARCVFMFIYTFHVPLLVFASGVFYSERNLRARILFYLSIGFAMKILNALCDRFVQGKTIGFSLLSDQAAPWYLFALAAFMLLRYLLRDKNKWFLLAAGIILACFAGYDKSIGDHLYLSRIIVFFPFYLAGSMADRELAPARIKKHWGFYIGAICVLALLFYFCCYRLMDVYKYRHLLTGRNPFSENVVSYGFFARLGCYALTAVTGLSAMILTPMRRLPMISDWGRNTLNVFFWHKLFYHLLVRFTPISGWFLHGGRGGQLAYLFAAAALAVLLAWGKCFSFPVEPIRKLCYSTDPDRK